ncbi:uncharacterized protein LOC117300419 [Asterias rubens]|uniref:uncharacterized protein LOC117300419 n=1 Tax=Asterias rubens TaxID=7604 RepID=UPI0014550436|nr:uncharacterized protein LOC117300419 [Asterias rubens]
MDITSNTLEDDKDCRPTGHDRQETEYHVASMAEGLAPTTAEGSEEPRCCDDEEFKHKLDDLKVKEKETSARLETVERRLTQTEAKMRSCDDMLVLIGLLSDRLGQVHPELGPLQGGEDAPKGQTDFASVPRAN